MTLRKQLLQHETEMRLKTAFDAGMGYYSVHPDENLIIVHRHASAIYSEKSEALEFVAGYSKARERREEFLREKSDQ
jgi:hypothetical protein